MEPRPSAILWYKIYLGILAVMYLMVVGVGVLLLFVPASHLDFKTSEDAKLIYAGSFVLVGLVFAVASLLPFAFQPKPWLWVYGIVMIALGMTSCCFWPICIPLLIHWLKPEVQRYYGKGMAAAPAGNENL